MKIIIKTVKNDGFCWNEIRGFYPVKWLNFQKFAIFYMVTALKNIQKKGHEKGQKKGQK